MALTLACGTRGLAFFGFNSAFSNHHPAPIAVDSLKFPTSEHHYMWSRAKHFREDVLAEQIRLAASPAVAKRLGKTVFRRGDTTEEETEPRDVTWKKVRDRYMAFSIVLKFGQNEALGEQLMRIDKEWYIWEAAKADNYWGTAVWRSEMGSMENEELPGQNRLGHFLMALRDLFNDPLYGVSIRALSKQPDVDENKKFLSSVIDRLIEKADGYRVRRQLLDRSVFDVREEVTPPLNIEKEKFNYCFEKPNLTTSSTPCPDNVADPPLEKLPFSGPGFGSTLKGPILSYRKSQQEPSLTSEKRVRTKQVGIRSATNINTNLCTGSNSVPVSTKKRTIKPPKNMPKPIKSPKTDCPSFTQDPTDIKIENDVEIQKTQEQFGKLSCQEMSSPYWVAQVGGKEGKVTCVRKIYRKELAGEPEIVETWEVYKNKEGEEKRLKLGDIVHFDSTTFQPTTYEQLVFLKARLDGTHFNPKLVEVYPVQLEQHIGIITGLRRQKNNKREGKPMVDCSQLEIPQRISPSQVIGLNYEELVPGKIVTVNLFKLPQQSRVHHSYYLLTNNPITGNGEKPVHEGYYLCSIEPLILQEDRLAMPIKDHSDTESLRKSQEMAALAITTYFRSIEDSIDKHTVESKLSKVPPLTDPITGEKTPNKRWIATYVAPSMSQLIEFKSLWRADKLVHIFSNSQTINPCAQGMVVKTRLINDMKVEIVITAAAIDSEAGADGWEAITELGYPAIIKIAPQINRLKTRAIHWAAHLPQRTARGTNAHGRIVATLLGLKHANPLRLNMTEAGECFLSVASELAELNEEQLHTVGALLSPEPGIIYQTAAPGSGKTYGVARAIPLLLKQRPNSRIILTTHGNMALVKLVQEIVPLVGAENCAVVLSSFAKEEFGHHFLPYATVLLSQTVENVLENSSEDPQAMEPSSRRRLVKYIKDCSERPRWANEKGVLQIMKDENLPLPPVVFITMSMLEACSCVTLLASHLIIDEAGQSVANQAVFISCLAPWLQKLVITGDGRQLHNYVADVPDIVHPWFHSLLTHCDHLDEHDIFKIKLVKSHRFHPSLAQALSDMVYGDEIICATKAADRDLLAQSTLPLPNREIPILLITQTGADMREQMSFSRHNRYQRDTVMEILNRLGSQHPNARVTCLTFYRAERDWLRRGLVPGSKVEVANAEGYQSRESDILIVVTTRAVNKAEKIRPNTFSFVHHQNRVTVALSRARHGIIVVGDLENLSRGEVWAKFFRSACKNRQNFIVGSQEYLSALEQNTPLNPHPLSEKFY